MTRNASTTFEAGPARAEMAAPTSGGTPRMLYGLIGTGLPHPKPTSRNASEPKRSRCRIGFSETRPSSFAVASPSARPVKACVHSWNVIAHISAGTKTDQPSGCQSSCGHSTRRTAPRSARRWRYRAGCSVPLVVAIIAWAGGCPCKFPQEHRYPLTQSGSVM